jgi:hypothetical protein
MEKMKLLVRMGGDLLVHTEHFALDDALERIGGLGILNRFGHPDSRSVVWYRGIIRRVDGGSI